MKLVVKMNANLIESAYTAEETTVDIDYFITNLVDIGIEYRYKPYNYIIIYNGNNECKLSVDGGYVDLSDFKSSDSRLNEVISSCLENNSEYSFDQTDIVYL